MADKEIMATGRRKTSIAVVKLVKGKGRIFVNGKTLKNYIGNRPAIEMLVYRPLVLTDNQEKYDVKVKAVGGGVVAQCGAIRHGISRALVKANEEYKNVLRLEENVSNSQKDNYIIKLYFTKNRHFCRFFHNKYYRCLYNNRF